MRVVRHVPRLGRARASLAAALWLLLPAAPLLGQAQSGNVFTRTVDEAGAPLPGVSVTLTGIGAPVTRFSDAKGETRFLTLSPGSYRITSSLSGFNTVERKDVVVALGKNTEVTLPMTIAGVESQVVVTGETPLLDTRRTSQGVNVTQQELASIPTARDPWVVLQSAPGILTDRLNVGGNESGQQSTFVAKGDSGANSTWQMDGVTITDMAAIGSSPGYYDFDSFQEMQVAVGGADVSLATAGAALNMVTKRGGNDLKGSARVFVTDKRFQANNLPDEAVAQGFQRGNRIDDTQDYGLELGGPLLKDRLWLWGAYSRNQVNLRTPSQPPAAPDGFSDKTTLEDINGKLNAQLGNSNSFTGFFSRGDKIKIGRNAAPTRPQETTWDQKGPTSVYKADDSHVFSSNVFAQAFFSYVDGGFSFTPEGGADAYAFRDPGGVNRGTYYFYTTVRPQRQLSGNVNGFFRTGTVGHELKAGFNYRNTPISSDVAWPHGIRMIERRTASGADNSHVRLYRNQSTSVDETLTAAFLSDTVTLDNLTITAGVRYDQQSGNNKASVSPANPSFPDVIPQLVQQETEKPFTWKNVSPRVGLTYSLGGGKSLIRATYGRFADQLPNANISYNNNAQYGYVWYTWRDKNGNHVAERSEVDFSSIENFYNIDPYNTTGPTPNRIDPDLKAGTTDEVTLSTERELVSGLAVSLTGTYRKFKNFSWTPNYGFEADGRFRVLGASDYELVRYADGVNPDGSAYHVPVYGLKETAPIPVGGYLTNRPDYEQTYKGLDLQLIKRYSNRWMARLALSVNDWKSDIGPGGIQDPTSSIVAYGSSSASSIVVAGAGVGSGAKEGIYINSRWSVTANAMYSLPAGFNVAGSFFAREGYPLATYDPTTPGDLFGPRNVLTRELGQARLSTLTNLDLRLEKLLKVSTTDITLSIDVFNALNNGVVLQRQLNKDVSTFNQITEIQSPRVVRFGGRLSF